MDYRKIRDLTKGDIDAHLHPSTVWVIGEVKFHAWSKAKQAEYVRAMRNQGFHRLDLEVNDIHTLILGDEVEAEIVRGQRAGPLLLPTATLPGPPSAGARLVEWFAPGDTAEAMLGDLEERFARRSVSHGAERARRWYWLQVTTVAVSFAWRWLQRLATLEAVLRRIGL